MEIVLEKFLKNKSPYWIFWGYALFSAIVLGSAFFVEYGLEIAPCAFCIYERWIYGIGGVLALVAIAHYKDHTIPSYLGLIGLVYLIGFFISAYHVAIEYHLVPLPRACGGGRFALDMNLDEMRQMLMKSAVVPCDRAPFELFGISLAGYNTILSIIIFAKSVWLADYFHQKNKEGL